MSRQQRRQHVVTTCRPTRDLELEDRHTRVAHVDGDGHLPMVLPRRLARCLPQDRLVRRSPSRALQAPARAPLQREHNRIRERARRGACLCAPRSALHP